MCVLFKGAHSFKMILAFLKNKIDLVCYIRWLTKNCLFQSYRLSNKYDLNCIKLFILKPLRLAKLHWEFVSFKKCLGWVS